MSINLTEAQGLCLYKRIVNAFSDFIDKQPGTGMNKIYRKFLDCGIKCMPKDKRALEIIAYTLSGTVPKAVQDLLNTSFSDLPLSIRPLYKQGNGRLVAFWCKEGKICTKVMDTIDFDASKGHWSDEKGQEVKLLSVDKED